MVIHLIFSVLQRLSGGQVSIDKVVVKDSQMLCFLVRYCNLGKIIYIKLWPLLDVRVQDSICEPMLDPYVCWAEY